MDKPLEPLISVRNLKVHYDLGGGGVLDRLTGAGAEPRVVKAVDGVSFDIRPGEFVLLKTENSRHDRWRDEFVYLERSGAEYLASIPISGVGIDALGIERAQPGHETHIALLEREIIILEGLRLRHVEPGNYLLIALPVKIADADGAPARAVLIDGELPTA